MTAHGRSPKACGPAEAWQDLADSQSGIVTRAQVMATGMTQGAIDARLERGRWSRLHPGVYATFSGPVPPHARLWAAVLACGDDAALGGRTALWLWGAVDAPGPVTTVCVPERRRVVAPDGAQVVRRRRLAERVHPVARPRRLRVEEALLDLTDEAKDDGSGRGEVVDLVLQVAASRRTTPERIRQSLGRRGRHRFRPLLQELLDEAADGFSRRWSGATGATWNAPMACPAVSGTCPSGWSAAMVRHRPAVTAARSMTCSPADRPAQNGPPD